MKNVFIATPISGFDNWDEYELFRSTVLHLIQVLRHHGYMVWSEIETVSTDTEYDSPEQSVIKDIKKIESSDMFILIHPRKMQTSTLFELGYAFSQSKEIIIIGKEENLPYMVKGLSVDGHYLQIIRSNNLDNKTIMKLISIIQKL